MIPITDHVDQALGRLITQYRGSVAAGINPLTLDPTGAFATRRLEGCLSSFVMKLHRDSDDVLIDVYDFNQNESEYKTSVDGSWVDMTGDTYFLDTLYNQNGNGNDMSQTTKTNKPTIVPDQRNGWPSIAFDGTDDRILTSVNMDQFVKNDAAILIAGFKPTGSPPIIGVPNPYLLDVILSDIEGWLLLTRGQSTPVSTNDRIWADNFSGSQDFASINIVPDTWYDVALKHISDLLTIFHDGVNKESTASGDTGTTFDILMVSGKHDFSSEWLSGDTDQYYTYDKELTDEQLRQIAIFMRTG